MKLRLKELEKYIPSDVMAILRTLRAEGHRAYLVGGCVRDLILAKSPLDWDIACSATPDQVQALYPDSLTLGKAYGTMGVYGESRSVGSREDHLLGIEKSVRPVHQVTAFRQDGSYGDHRHPAAVLFGTSIEQDLARRDFTMNAIAYDPIDRELIDLYQGIEDLKFEKIRCVGQARERLLEDTLRPFRAIRFVAQMGFALEAQTFAAITTLSRSMPLPAPERIGSEFQKLMKGAHFVSAIEALLQTGLWSRIFSTWSIDEASAWFAEQREKISQQTDLLRVAALLATRPDAGDMLRQLGYSKQDAAWVLRLIDNQLDEARARLEVADIRLKATDLIGLGLRGEAIGAMQRSLLQFIKENPSRNRKPTLLEECKRLMSVVF